MLMNLLQEVCKVKSHTDSHSTQVSTDSRINKYQRFPNSDTIPERLNMLPVELMIAQGIVSLTIITCEFYTRDRENRMNQRNKMTLVTRRNESDTRVEEESIIFEFENEQEMVREAERLSKLYGVSIQNIRS